MSTQNDNLKMTQINIYVAHVKTALMHITD